MEFIDLPDELIYAILDYCSKPPPLHLVHPRFHRVLCEHVSRVHLFNGNDSILPSVLAERSSLTDVNIPKLTANIWNTLVTHCSHLERIICDTVCADSGFSEVCLSLNTLKLRDCVDENSLFRLYSLIPNLQCLRTVFVPLSHQLPQVRKLKVVKQSTWLQSHSVPEKRLLEFVSSRIGTVFESLSIEMSFDSEPLADMLLLLLPQMVALCVLLQTRTEFRYVSPSFFARFETELFALLPSCSRLKKLTYNPMRFTSSVREFSDLLRVMSLLPNTELLDLSLPDAEHLVYVQDSLRLGRLSHVKKLVYSEQVSGFLLLESLLKLASLRQLEYRFTWPIAYDGPRIATNLVSLTIGSEFHAECLFPLMPNLTLLSLPHCEEPPVHLLRSVPNLRSLQLRNQSEHTSEAEFLAGVLRFFPELESLDLERKSFPGSDLVSDLSAFALVPLLRSLQLRSVRVRSAPLTQLMRQLPALETLMFLTSHVTVECLPVLATMGRKLTRLTLHAVLQTPFRLILDMVTTLSAYSLTFADIYLSKYSSSSVTIVGEGTILRCKEYGFYLRRCLSDDTTETVD